MREYAIKHAQRSDSATALTGASARARRAPGSGLAAPAPAEVAAPRGGHHFGRVRVLAATRPAGASGRPLDPALRAHFEPLLGRDLGDIRLHTGGQASDFAESLGATAVTAGRDIAFRAGAPGFHTAAGRRLLGHELIHTVQQASASDGATAARVSDPADAAEREADAGSAALAGGRPFQPVARTAGVLARDVEKPTAALAPAAGFSQDAGMLRVTIPLPELFQSANMTGGFTNRVLIRARLMAGNATVAAVERRADIVFDLWDEEYGVSVDGRARARYKTLGQALAASWTDIAFPSSLLAPGVSYTVAGEAMLNLITHEQMDQQLKGWLGASSGVYPYLVWKFTRVPPDRAEGWVSFRTQSYTAR